MERLKQHYKLLRIKPGAKLDEIKRAYLLAEQNLHDDRLSDDPLVRHLAQERLRKINEAYMEIMDAYKEVRASLGVGDSHHDANGSTGMPTAIAVAETGSDVARRSSREQINCVIPKEGDHSEDMSQSVAAAGKQQEKGAPGDTPFTSIGDTATDREEHSAEKKTSDYPNSAEEEAAIPDPADMVRTESYLLYMIVALVFLVMVITWFKTARKGSPPEAAVKSTAPAETANPTREISEPKRTAPKSSVKPRAKGSLPVRQPAALGTVDPGRVIRDAEQGNAKAQALLGYMYVTGNGVRTDPSAAARWFRAAADQGSTQAQDWLGYLYETGTGVPRNYPEAVRWYRLAAEKGDADGQKNLGRMYAKGRGVAKNQHEAIKWLRKAATQGNEEAQRRLDIWQED